MFCSVNLPGDSSDKICEKYLLRISFLRKTSSQNFSKGLRARFYGSYIHLFSEQVLLRTRQWLLLHRTYYSEVKCERRPFWHLCHTK